MNCQNNILCCVISLFVLSGCGISTKNHDEIIHAVSGIGNKKKGDSIKSEFQVLSKCLTEYPLIDSAEVVPAETINRNPPLGFKWKTFFVDSEMCQYLGYKSISISLKVNKNDFEYGGDLMLTK